MKRLHPAAAAFFGFVASGSAADLDERVGSAASVQIVPVFAWAGLYAGLNAGYGFHAVNDRPAQSSVFIPAGHGPEFFAVTDPGGTVAGLDPFTTIPAPGLTVPLGNICGPKGCDARKDGFVGGGQVGYNYQLAPGSRFVAGVEGDIQYADFNAPRSENFVRTGSRFPGGTLYGSPPSLLRGTGRTTFTFLDPRLGPERGVDWFGTVRGRIGYSFRRFLLYGTGGLAYGGGPRNSQFGFQGLLPGGGPATIPACSLGVIDCGGRMRVGWTAGTGIEFGFSRNLSVKIEGLYVAFDRSNHGNPAVLGGSLPYAKLASSSGAATFFAPASAFSHLSGRAGDQFAVIRAGLNYRPDFSDYRRPDYDRYTPGAPVSSVPLRRAQAEPRYSGMKVRLPGSPTDADPAPSKPRSTRRAQDFDTSVDPAVATGAASAADLISMVKPGRR